MSESTLPQIPADCSCESLFGGRLSCLQHRHGYRFSVDAVLLAHFVKPDAGACILDLGAGCGIVSLIIAYRFPDTSLTALEIQPPLASLIKANVARNNFAAQISAQAGDLRRLQDYIVPGSFDLVVCNPPYQKANSSRLNREQEKAIARHEIKADLPAVVRAISVALTDGGKGAVVYPARHRDELLAELCDNNLSPRRLQMVHGYPGSPGKLVLVEAQKNGGQEFEILPPFFISQEKGGAYTPEMARCYAG
ncbi:MAG: methyltransferase [Proteobacteria bacterium]|nr:methyltransferase [Pseudomonadota bacterium]MBU1716777.1 methyltransferase [Pseudomonadota bacterium]